MNFAGFDGLRVCKKKIPCLYSPSLKVHGTKTSGPLFGYPNTLFFYRGIKVHPCDLNAVTQLVYHLMNY